MANNTNNTILQAALDAALGRTFNWPVTIFPAPIDGAKKGCKAARHSGGRKWGQTSDENEIRRDWARFGTKDAEPNLGLPMGPDNRLWAVEVDTKEGHGVDGLQNFAALVARLGPLPETSNGEVAVRVHPLLFPVADRRRCSDQEHGQSDRPGRRHSRLGRNDDAAALAAERHRVRLAQRSAARGGTRGVGGGGARGVAQDGGAAAPPTATRTATSTVRCGAEGAAEPDASAAGPAGDGSSGTRSDGGFAATGGSTSALKLFMHGPRRTRRNTTTNTQKKSGRSSRRSPPYSIGAGFVFSIMYTINPNWERLSNNDYYFCDPGNNCLVVPTGSSVPRRRGERAAAGGHMVDASGLVKTIKPSRVAGEAPGDRSDDLAAGRADDDRPQKLDRGGRVEREARLACLQSV